jgi:hypothetical protein
MAAKTINRTYKVTRADPVRTKANWKSKKLRTLAVGTKFTATKIDGYYLYVPAYKGWTLWKDSKGQKYVTLISNNQTTTASKLLTKLKEVAKKFIAGGVKYSANGAKKSLAAILKYKKTNCATYVSAALQEIGILPKGKYIWLSTSIHGDKAAITAIKKKAKITYPKTTWKNAGLKKGDICGFANKPHTQVYAGKSKSGYPLWYSCGGSDISAKNLGPKRKKSYESRKIYVRIRLK